VAIYILDRFVANIEEIGHVSLWNKRCELIVALEKQIATIQ